VAVEEVLDFSACVAQAPIAEEVGRALLDAAGHLNRPADPACVRLRELAAKRFGVYPVQVLAGGDVTEFIYAAPRALRTRRAVVLAPCLHDYWRAVELAGGEAEGLLAVEPNELVPDLNQLASRLSGVDLLFVGNPNNPTGVTVPAESLTALARRFPSVTFVIDETYAEFVPESQGVSLLPGTPPANVAVLRTPTPYAGLAGLPASFLIASEDLCGVIDRAREPLRLSLPAQRAAEALMAGERPAAETRQAVIAERERLRESLSHTPGLRVFRSQANFLLLKITRPGLTSATLSERLLRRKVLVRNASAFRGLDSRFVRIAVRSPADNDRLLEAVRHALDEGKS
jgi:histidinol-phosphate/aromatic aminotransferase/cobyric acid decarboxylase-like protein